MERSKLTTPAAQASGTWEHLEYFVREHAQPFIQTLLEEEITECEALREQFTTRYRKVAPKAVERLGADWNGS